MIRPMRWDIFCRVVDNFGDIGVCWRLARILAAQHACEVRLIVDRPELLQRIVATPSESLNASKYKGIEVVRWGSTSPSECDCDVVVEAFAAIGWQWGGHWTTLKDWQHFSQNGR